MSIEEIIASRKDLSLHSFSPGRKGEAEGGCGVIGVACAEQIKGKHLLSALCQMQNRGNGKGGGIAAAGMCPEAFGVSQKVLENDYLLAIAYLDENCRDELERKFITANFEIDHIHRMPSKQDKALPITPPAVVIYFVRVKSSIANAFAEKNGLSALSKESIEDEFVYQNSYQLNQAYYSSTGEKRAFVLSNGKDLLVLKLVGFAEDVISYYQLEDFKAYVWIGHHRYPTKGKVWHPGGAHPFVGLHEALVHNGDFANYSSMCEYLSQRNIYPHFLTDTEVAVLVFDLLHRTYQYPLEYVIEALAPTTEWDFSLLSAEKQRIYKMLQKTHIHGSPDGPWFFLVAQSILEEKKRVYRLTGITDTSMLRPQVFALQNGLVPIGFSASEKQAIDAVLKSLSAEDERFWEDADYYWNARGGSHTDGGAFSFTVYPEANDQATLICADKFGQLIHQEPLKAPYVLEKSVKQDFPDMSSMELFEWVKRQLRSWHYDHLVGFLDAIVEDENHERTIEVLTNLRDRHFLMAHLRRSSLKSLINLSLRRVFESLIQHPTEKFVGITLSRKRPQKALGQQTLIIDASGFAPEGEHSLAREVVEMYKCGFQKIILFNCLGQRFIGNGLGSSTNKVRIDVYGSPGDYLASGIDGMDIFVHGSAQDQLSQIMKDGRLVVYGDVGQTFMYGAKGGRAFILGNAAGRPLINAVGRPRVVINGTCLDYLAESFMAGNPLSGGGFVVINGLRFDVDGRIKELPTPYPGNNLFSLASGGAIYIRDPAKKVMEAQLNGGQFTEVTQSDWDLILPYLEENADHFDIPIARLLEFEGQVLSFQEAYRKIRPAHIRALQVEEAWVKEY